MIRIQCYRPIDPLHLASTNHRYSSNNLGVSMSKISLSISIYDIRYSMVLLASVHVYLYPKARFRFQFYFIVFPEIMIFSFKLSFVVPESFESFLLVIFVNWVFIFSS